MFNLRVYRLIHQVNQQNSCFSPTLYSRLFSKRSGQSAHTSRAALGVAARFEALKVPSVPVHPKFDPVTGETEYDALSLAHMKSEAVKWAKQVEYQERKAAKRRKLDVQENVFLPEGSNDEVLRIEVEELMAALSLRPKESDKTEVSSKTEEENGHVLNNIDAAAKAEDGEDEADEQVSAESAPISFNPFSTRGGVEAENSETQLAPVQRPTKKPAELNKEVELEIVRLSSTGDGLAYNEAKDHVIVVPFSVPGDRVLAKPWKWGKSHTIADFIKVIRPSPLREGIEPRCKYFSSCSGCQFQMIPYKEQLKHKRTIVVNAFRHFSGLRPEKIPEVDETMGSPLQYDYRTKLSPHYSGPSGDGTRNSRPKYFNRVPNIGYNKKGTSHVMDIETCPIGTTIVQEGLRLEREYVQDSYRKLSGGATILLRETTRRGALPSQAQDKSADDQETAILASTNIASDWTTDIKSQKLETLSDGFPQNTIETSTHIDYKTYINDNNDLATEYITTTIDPTTTPPQTRTYKFTNTAGAFFQNNNSILGPFTSYVYAHCIPAPALNATAEAAQTTASLSKPIKYLLDAYCGSGLFTLSLSSRFTSSLGIDVDPRSIASARSNATENNVTNAGFIHADAAHLFADVPYPAAQAVCIIDPPRKGCDRAFLKQLRRYGPKRVVYVSCNVHSQARDVGVLVDGFTQRDRQGDVKGIDHEWEEDSDGRLWRYEIETIKGFDFFPQTGHVEGVCVLNRVEV